MKLRLDVSLAAFLHCASICEGEVLYRTSEGDQLNLKSRLSQYIFLAAADRKDSAILRSGQVVCTNTDDYQKLMSYLTE